MYQLANYVAKQGGMGAYTRDLTANGKQHRSPVRVRGDSNTAIETNIAASRVPRFRFLGGAETVPLPKTTTLVVCIAAARLAVEAGRGNNSPQWLLQRPLWQTLQLAAAILLALVVLSHRFATMSGPPGKVQPGGGTRVPFYLVEDVVAY